MIIIKVKMKAIIYLTDTLDVWTTSCTRKKFEKNPEHLPQSS